MSNETSNQVAIDKAKKIGEDLYTHIVLEAPVSKLPEKVFQEAFLPYFTGQKKVSDNPEILKIWVSIAGNPGSAVDITDNNSDDILFRVPPLYNTDFVQAPSNGSIPYAGIIEEYEQRSATSPKQGETFLKSVLDNTRKMVVTNNNHVEEYREMWNKIFDRYHITAKDEKKNPEGLTDEELVFD